MDEPALMDLAADIDRPDWQATRLAELVMHLTGCSTEEALLAVGDSSPDATSTDDDALERVARALVSVRRTTKYTTK